MITYNYFFLTYYNTHKYKATATKGLFISADVAKLVLHVKQTETLASRNTVILYRIKRFCVDNFSDFKTI